MDLEELTNKQLRQKCLQYGLPNVPVTDTNRNILLRRLNAAMNGTAPKKPNTPKKSTPNNRRKTVNATITTTVSSGDEDDIILKTQRTTNAEPIRRRQTIAPVTTKASPTKPKPSAPKHVAEHNIPIGFDSLASSTRIGSVTGTAPNDRLRRSVSLSKTGVLTTSYSTETSKIPLNTTYEQDMEADEYDEPEEDDADDIEMENAEELEAAKVYTHPAYSGYNPPASYGFAVPAPPQPSAPANKLYPDLQSSILQNDYYNSFDGMRASHSSSARQTSLGYTHNAPTSYMPSPQSLSSSGLNRQTIGSGSSTFGSGGILAQAPYYQSNLTSTKRYTTGGLTKRHTARDFDNDELAASSSDDQYEAPYLSKFSRNLENIKPEPLYKRTASATSYTSLSPKRRRGAYDDDEANTFSQLWAKLEQRYHVKTAFYFILVFVIAAFIYVFFLQ